MKESQTCLWYPLRIAYSSNSKLLRIKDQLDNEPTVARTFVPMEYQIIDFHRVLVPAVNNLIFINTTYDCLQEIKSRKQVYEPLRYFMHKVEREGFSSNEVVHVPNRKMDDFIRVTSERNENVVFMDNLEFACRPGQRVEIIEGPFAGVEGVIKRIKGNVCVIIPIEEVAAVAIQGVPRSHLRYLGSDNESLTKH